MKHGGDCKKTLGKDPWTSLICPLGNISMKDVEKNIFSFL